MTRTGDIVLAHAFGERYELPVPLVLYLVGGAAVVVLSFVLLLRRTTPAPAVLAVPEAPDTVPPQPLRPLPALLSLAVTLFVVVVGLTGTQDPTYNLAAVGFWLVVWIGGPLSCGLLGDWTRPVNPFAVIARVGDDASLRKAVLARREPLEWPPGLGWWPAVVLFVLLVLGELVFQLDATKPAFVGSMLVLYLLASFFLGLLFGPGWLARGEVFSALFNAWGRLGYFRFGAPGRRGFAGGLDVPFEASPSRVVFVLLMLVSINFDGLIATPQYLDWERTTLGVASTDAKLLLTVSLVALVLVVLAVFGAFATLSASVGRLGQSPLRALAGLLPSLVPIAFGYLVAHYLQYLLTNGQLLVGMLSNPGFGQGNTGFEVDRALLPNSFYWYVSVVVIVAVHVVAVVIAHRFLTSRAADESLARRAEYPWLVAMVGYTAFSIYLIAQPLTSTAATTALAFVGAPFGGLW
jgi:hypothetical protein